MKDILNKSIDMILCDLPYGTTACKWDVVIPFEPLWEQYKRIIKDRGAIVLFGSEPFSSYLRISNIKQYKYDWVWNKKRPSNFFAAKFMPLNDTEDICVFSRGGVNNGSKNPVAYYPQDTRKEKRIIKNSCSVGGKVGEAHKTTMVRGGKYIQEQSGYPKKTISMVRDTSCLHPTQKPVALLEYLIKTYTLEGETVLDNCMGSGSTGVACINTNRNFIGIEKDDKYFEIAKKRIEEHLTTASTQEYAGEVATLRAAIEGKE